MLTPGSLRIILALRLVTTPERVLGMILSYYAHYARGYIPLEVSSTSGMASLEIALALGKALIEGHGGRMRVLYGRLRCRLGVGNWDHLNRRPRTLL